MTPPSSPAPPPRLILEFRGIIEPNPGPRIAAAFEAYWPAYQRWLRRTPAGGHAAPTVAECEAQFLRHMPELAPTRESLLALVGDEPEKRRFLSLWRPPPIVRGCSQAITRQDGASVLVRNYDYAPWLCDGLLLASRWGGVGVHAVTDCIWGALDGVNEHGLVVALAFGGRRDSGQGFAASLVVRYLLQTCATVAEAKAALSRIPVSMAYNFTLLDRGGAHATAYTSPLRPTTFSDRLASTNHQDEIDWPEYARFAHTVERCDFIEQTLAGSPGTEAVIGAFLHPPLFRREFRRGAGTIYTALYDPRSMTIRLYWPHAQAAAAPTDDAPLRVLIDYAHV